MRIEGWIERERRAEQETRALLILESRAESSGDRMSRKDDQNLLISSCPLTLRFWIFPTYHCRDNDAVGSRIIAAAILCSQG